MGNNVYIQDLGNNTMLLTWLPPADMANGIHISKYRPQPGRQWLMAKSLSDAGLMTLSRWDAAQAKRSGKQP